MGEYHRLTVRMSKDYHAYLENVAYRTHLDMSQIIRLLIHLAPDNTEFNQIIQKYTRNDRKGLLVITDFRDHEGMWKRC